MTQKSFVVDIPLKAYLHENRIFVGFGTTRRDAVRQLRIIYPRRVVQDGKIIETVLILPSGTTMSSLMGK
jgi:hypothetical protein